MSPSLPLLANPERNAPRLALPTPCLLQRIAAAGLRLALASSMIALAVVEPRLWPSFALTIPFWIATELECLLARNRGRLRS